MQMSVKLRVSDFLGVALRSVGDGEMLVLTNPLTQEEQECRVVYLGEPLEKGQRVGIEFLTPAPRFWGVEFREGNSSSSVN